MRTCSLAPQMALQNVIHQALQNGAVAAHRPEREGFHPPLDTLLRMFAAVEPDLKRPAFLPEPVLARRRNHGNSFVAQCGIEIDAPCPFQKLLLKKPLLDP